jgi:16S rRNA (adenine1518-N6/adenine1519-N6)-dimethyltransferase
MIRAKKTLSQNFLNSRAIARDMVRAGNLSSTDTVLEIGPGKGFLTAELLAFGARVIAVEKDDRLIPILTEKFSLEISKGQLTVIHGDIVELMKRQALSLPLSYKLIANIPYQITGQILRMFLGADIKPERMILMVQKEVAARIVARRKESILSLSVKAYGTPRIIKKVPARYFSPAPNVDSAILAIDNISNENFKSLNEEQHFFEIIKTGFAHKRKQVGGNLKNVFGPKTTAVLVSAHIAPSTRAEDIPLTKWLTIAQKSSRSIDDKRGRKTLL